jgi:Ca2+-binding EF-hand superfamily protein
MKGLHDVTSKWFLIGILAATSVLAQNRNDAYDEENSTENNRKDYSHEKGSRLEVTFNSMDTDADGKISRTEFDSAFARMDTNGDGYLSSDECRMGETKHIKEPPLSAPRDVKIR